MAHLSKVQQKLERHAELAEKKVQRKVGKDVKTSNRYVLRQLRLQLKHERDMKKIESGYYHKRAEEVAEVGKIAAESVGQILVSTVGILPDLIRGILR